MLLNFNNEKLGEELNNAYYLFINLIERSKYEIWNKKDIDERLSMVILNKTIITFPYIIITLKN